MLDEPTAALGVQQTANVHKLIRSLRDQGAGIVLITHNLADAFALADLLFVLRHGRRVARIDPKRSTLDQVIGAITGTSFAELSRAS